LWWSADVCESCHTAEMLPATLVFRLVGLFFALFGPVL
jgi:hypothetical protein